MKFLRSIGDCWIHGIVLICALQIASKDPNRHRFVRVTTPIGLHETSRLVRTPRRPAASAAAPTTHLSYTLPQRLQVQRRHVAVEAERGPIADYPYLALDQQLQATGLALAPVLERVVQLDRDPLRHDVDEPLIIGLHPGWDRCCGEIPTPSKVGMLPRNSLSNVLMPDSTASSLGPHYVTHIGRTQCCGPSLPKLQPASNREEAAPETL